MIGATTLHCLPRPAQTETSAKHSGVSGHAAPFPCTAKLLSGLLLAFLFLNAADLFLTWKLLRGSDGRFLESNPVAAWSLARYGWLGMTALKLGSVTAVVGLAWVLARNRPQVARLILGFGCGAVSTAVMQSVLLGTSFDTRFGAVEQRFSGASWAVLPENPPLRLLDQRAVRLDLHLSEAQLVRVAHVRAARDEMRRTVQTLGREAWNAAVKDQVARESDLLEDLGPARTDRLHQIELRQRGAVAFSDPMVCETLRLSAAQKRVIDFILAQPTMHPAVALKLRGAARNRRACRWPPARTFSAPKR